MQPVELHKMNSDYSKTTKATQNEGGSTANQKVLKLVYTIIFAVLIYLDYYNHDSFMDFSVSLITQMQISLGPVYGKIGYFISYGVIFLPAFYLIYRVIHPRCYAENQYYIQLIVLAVVATLILKAAYGRGRPEFVGQNVIAYDCCCDYGMPSGHSSFALTGFHILAFALAFGVSSREKSLGTGLLQLACYVGAILVGWSRLQLGAHALNQVVYGFLLSGFVILIWTWRVFKRTLKLLSLGKTSLAVGSLFWLATIFAYFWLVKKDIESEPSPRWKYWTKCPNCSGTFKYEQITTTTAITGLGTLVLGYAINFKISRSDRHKLNERSAGLFFKRLGAVLIVLLFTGVISLGVSALFVGQVPDNLYGKAYLKAILLFVALNILCAMLSGGLAWVFASLGLAVEADFYREDEDGLGYDGTSTSKDRFNRLDVTDGSYR